jgi:hypothetical protein
VSIDGYVNTSSGRVETQVHQQISFGNSQQVDATATLFQQNIAQTTTVTSDTATITASGSRTAVHEQKSWPLSLDYSFVVNSDGSAAQTTAVNQGKIEQSTATTTATGTPLQSYLSNTVISKDTLTFPATGGYIPSNGASSQTYTARTSTGYCYSKTVKSANYQITSNSGGPC